MDKRANNGGKRKGAGRKPKADEHKLIEKLNKYEDAALDILRDKVLEGHSWAIKLYMEYAYGKPTETKDVNLKTDLNIPNLPDIGNR